MAPPTIEEIEQDFAVLDDWEDRYKYIIELGKELPPLEDVFRTAANKVQGCASQVWLQSFVSNGAGNTVLRFAGDSEQFCRDVLQAVGVAITPGIDFGAHRAKQHVRIAYTIHQRKLEDGIERLRAFLS